MASSSASSPPDDLEWEEWDAASSPLSFAHHCLAGSFAGVAEHTLLYPLDTVKTCWQSQVLGGCGESSSCGVGAAVEKMRGGSGVGPMATVVENAKSAVPPNPAAASASNKAAHSQGIWSTMKHLMQQGHHHHPAHPHGHPVNSQISHAVYTLAGNPPNVVDFTANGSESASRAAADAAKSGTKRPWSRQSRMVRHATLDDITARGMIRASGVGGSGGTLALGADAVAPPAGNAGFMRLWRGVQTMFVGCIPAHALYFSSYEVIKAVCTDQGQPHHNGGGDQQQPHEGHVGHDTLSTSQAMLAGGVATLLHDFVMTPMDTMKQRMQLGHYDNLRHAFGSIVWGDNGSTNAATKGAGRAAGEGWRGLYRSFPVTVMTNVPYGMIMMTTNEWLRGALEDGMYGMHSHHGEHGESPFHFATILFAGMGAGAIASAATAPLDRVKTRLQTQRMGMVLPPSAGGSAASGAILEERAVAAARGQPKVCPKMAVRDVQRALFPSSSIGAASTSNAIPSPVQSIPQTPQTPFRTYYSTPLEAFQSILQEEGPRGLFRGTLPRVALHAPSVAISWTAYEMAKDWLVWMQQ